MSSPYLAGTCNIGKGEIRRRQIIGLIGLIFSISSFATLVTTDAPRGARLGIFLPLMVASIGWVQSRAKFCLAYGFIGTFNFGKFGQISRVSDPVSRAADRATALKILFKSAALAALVTAMIYILPI